VNVVVMTAEIAVDEMTVAVAVVAVIAEIVAVDSRYNNAYLQRRINSPEIGK
jgi:hypothetical protein